MKVILDQRACRRQDGAAAARLRARLFAQQLWCWGRDVVHPAGNLLVKFGFSRLERPAGRSCASLYRLEHRPQARIILRGFGAFLGDDRQGGVFLRRDETRARLTPTPDLTAHPWEPAELPPLLSPTSPTDVRRCAELHAEFCEWTARYEQWVVATCGLVYRRRTVEQWRQFAKRRVVAYDSVGSAWLAWGRDLLGGSAPS